MAQENAQQTVGDDDFLDAAFGLGMFILAGYGLYKLLNKDEQPPQQQRISEMEQEIGRMLSGRDGL